MTEETPPPVAVQIDAAALDAFVVAQRKTFRSLVRFIIVVTAVVAMFIGFLVWRSYTSQSRTECITRTQAVAFGELVSALKGAPTDPTRNAKLDRAATELAKLVDVGETCG